MHKWHLLSTPPKKEWSVECTALWVSEGTIEIVSMIRTNVTKAYFWYNMYWLQPRRQQKKHICKCELYIKLHSLCVWEWGVSDERIPTSTTQQQQQTTRCMTKWAHISHISYQKIYNLFRALFVISFSVTTAMTATRE